MEKSNEVESSIQLKSSAIELAEIAKLKKETQKIDLEIKQLKLLQSLPWYKSHYFMQALIAGLISVPIMWFFFDTIVKPTVQKDVIQKDLLLSKKEKELYEQNEILKSIENKTKMAEKEVQLNEQINLALRNDLTLKEIEFREQVTKLKIELKNLGNRPALKAIEDIGVEPFVWNPMLVSEPVPGTDSTLMIHKVHLNEENYFRIPTKKQAIVLHTTYGWGIAKSFWSVLQNGSRGKIAPAYLIERDGSVYEFFDPEFYAWALGSTVDPLFHRQSISIEFSNWGNLIDQKSYTGRKIDPSEITMLSDSFRGYKYWHRFTEEQYEAANKLLRYLTARFDIPLEFTTNIDEQIPIEQQSSFRGVLSHSNVRLNKLDMGGVNWHRIINDAGGIIKDSKSRGKHD